MKTKNRQNILVAVLFSLLAAVTAFGAPMSFRALAQRLPAASNAVVAINVNKVLNSAYAKREHWATNAADAWAKEPVMIPPGASRLIMAASVKTSSMDSYWEMSLIEMDKMPSLQELASCDGGHIDRVWDKDAVYSPINAYFIPLAPTILASITPAERSEIARWVRQPVKPEGNITSAYINTVIAGLSENTDIVMAMDLDDAFGLPDIRRFIDDNEIKEIPQDKIDSTVELLGTIKGITLEVHVDENITAKASVEFEADAAPLNPCAKSLMIAVLKRVGMRTADVQDFEFAAEGKTLTMHGNMSADGLREYVGLIQSPIPAAAVAGPNKNGAARAAASPTEASQRYYKTISICINTLQPGASASITAGLIRNVAKRIEQLPILNVDPALVDWGAMVSARLKQSASVLSVGQVQIDARVLGVKDPDYVTYTYDQGRISASSSVSNSNANKERRQVAAQQKAETYQQTLKILEEITDTIPKIRADMVAKYNVEF